MAQNGTFSPIDDLEAISQLYGQGVCFGRFWVFLGVFGRHFREAVASSKWAGPHERKLQKLADHLTRLSAPPVNKVTALTSIPAHISIQ